MSERSALILSFAVILIGLALIVAVVAKVRSTEAPKPPVSAISDYLAFTGKDAV